MSAEQEYLQSLYGKKDNDELLELHSKGALSDVAYSVLEGELTSRGIKIPPRPLEPEFVETPTPKWLLVCIFIFLVFLLHFIWVAIAKPIVGGGFIPEAIFTLLPLLFFWKKMFPKKDMKK